MLLSELALEDPTVKSDCKQTLMKRVVRLSKPPRRWKVPTFPDLVLCDPKETFIEGTLLTSITGRKSKFMGADGACSVEDLALQYYNQLDQWSGIHCEGSIFRFFFGVFFWDIIFASVPDVFQTPFQGIYLVN